jgi:hypothetical protein
VELLLPGTLERDAWVDVEGLLDAKVAAVTPHARQESPKIADD